MVPRRRRPQAPSSPQTRQDAIAIQSYLLLNVKNPPPELWVSNPALYLSKVRSAGGRVIIMFMLHAGFPMLDWQYSARTHKGKRNVSLYSLAFHLHRSVAFKTKSVFIALEALVALCCAHKSLRHARALRRRRDGALCLASDLACLTLSCRPLVESCSSMNFLGHTGCSVYNDKANEYLNKMFQERAMNARDFMVSTHWGPHLKYALHIEQMWKKWLNGESELNDPIRQYHLDNSEHIRRELVCASLSRAPSPLAARPLLLLSQTTATAAVLAQVKELGTDLTQHQPHLPFWWSRRPGTPGIVLSAGDYRERRPWERIWACAIGAVVGKGRQTARRWQSVVNDFISDHLFEY